MNKTNKKFKDPGSAITHLIAMIGAVICAFPLIGKAVHTNNSIVVFAMSVFISSMILLYGASTLYHSLDISKKVNGIMDSKDTKSQSFNVKEKTLNILAIGGIETIDI